MRYIGTIGVTPFSSIEDRRIRAAIGRILPCDDGKRVFEIKPGIYQVENEQQRNRRLEEEA